MKYIFSLLLFVFIQQAVRAQTYNLDYYTGQSVQNSPLLKDINNQILIAQLDSLRIRAGFKPQVNFNGGGLYAPVIRGYGYAGAITNNQTLDGLISVNKNFIGKNYANAQFYGLQLQRDSLGNVSKLSEQDLRKSVISQYVTAYGDLQQYRFSKEVVQLLTTEEEILKKLTRANVYRQTDYLTFLVTLKQQELQVKQAMLQYKNDFAILNYLSGVRDTVFKELADPNLSKASLPAAATSIFFKQYQLDSLRFRNGRKLIDYSYRPRLNVFADAGYNTDFSDMPYKNFGSSAGFSLIVPIYDGGLRKLSYKRLALEEQSRQNYKLFFTSQYRQQIDQYNQQIAENERLLVDINEQIKYTESLIKVDTKLLETGDLKISDLIIAVNNYLSVKNLLTQTTISRLQLINQFNYFNR